MPEAGRLLKFPRRRSSSGLQPAEATAAAYEYLAIPPEERDDDLRRRLLSDPDVLAVLLRLLVDERETQPQGVFEEAASLHRWLRDSGTAIGLFDEREYLLGETASIAAVSARLLGQLDEAECWLDRAEAGYRHTVNPAPLLANVAYQRLSVRYESRKFTQLLELLPSLVESFNKLGMTRERAKAKFLEAITLKECDRKADSLQVLAEIRLDSAGGDRGLLGQVLIEVGEQHGLEGRYQEALVLYQEALPLLLEGGRPMSLPHLKSVIGETLAANGQQGSAVGAFREAIHEFEQFGLKPNACRIRLILADTLLALDRAREAEWEILAALPTIEEQKMVPEGFAAVALLKESVRRRKTDPNALRELREHLQATK
jgi:tetratricopeptide (TPR) repeat protein